MIANLLRINKETRFVMMTNINARKSSTVFFFCLQKQDGERSRITEAKLLPHSSHLSCAQHSRKERADGGIPPDSQLLVQCLSKLLADTLPTTVYRERTTEYPKTGQLWWDLQRGGRLIGKLLTSFNKFEKFSMNITCVYVGVVRKHTASRKSLLSSLA